VTSIDVMRMNANQVRKLEYEIQVEIATLEKQLTQARERLAAVRRSEYSASHGDGTGAPKSGSPVSTPGRQDSSTRD
jgi:septal ring factor EnvC (AmiA/AmiB activator)